MQITVSRCLLPVLTLLAPLPVRAGLPDDFTQPPHRVWTFATRGPMTGSPAIAGSVVLAGSADSTLYALDLHTGAVLWTARTGGPVKSTPCVRSGRVYLNCGDGSFRCFALETGRQIWEFRTGGERVYEPYGYADYYQSSPVVEGELLFAGSGDGCVYALDARSGTLRWKYSTGDVVHSTPAVDGDRVYAGSFDGSVVALKRETGELLWRFKTVGHRFFPKGEVQGSPVAGNGLVYVGARDYNIYAIDREKGYCHWNRAFPLGWALSLSLRDTTLVVGTSDDDLVLALDGRSGKEVWKTNVNFNTFGRSAFTTNAFILGSLQGILRSIDLATGSVRWEHPTEGHAVHRSRYFPAGLAAPKSEFYAIVQTPEGYIRALRDLGAIFSDPVVTQDHIVFTAADGTVTCLSR